MKWKEYSYYQWINRGGRFGYDGCTGKIRVKSKDDLIIIINSYENLNSDLKVYTNDTETQHYQEMTVDQFLEFCKYEKIKDYLLNIK